MTRARTPIFGVLLLSVALSAQNTAGGTGSGNNCTNPPAAGASILEVGIFDSGAYVYSCPDQANAPQVTDIKLRVTAPKKTWFSVIPYTYLDPATPGIGPGGNSAQDIIDAHPFMAPPISTDPATLNPSWAGQPHLVVDPSLVWYFLNNAIFDPVTGQLSDLVCRDMFVPMLEEIPPGPAEHNARVWSAKPPGWLADQSGYGIGPAMSTLWRGTLFGLTENPDAEVFAAEGLARLAIQLQAPTRQIAKEFMNSPMFSDAMSLGLLVNAQVVCIIDSNNTTPPGTTDLNAPGLGLPNLPTVTFTNPITVSIAIVAPATGGTPGAGSIAPAQHYRWRLRGIYPDTVFHFPGPLASPVTSLVQWEGRLSNSMLFGLTVPGTAQSGDILVDGPFTSLSVLWSGVTLGGMYQ